MIGGRPAREITIELADWCQGDDAWLMASSDTGEFLGRVRVVDDSDSLTVGIVPIPEAGAEAHLAFYDFNVDNHLRTAGRVREREQIVQSLSITVE